MCAFVHCSGPSCANRTDLTARSFFFSFCFRFHPTVKSIVEIHVIANDSDCSCSFIFLLARPVIRWLCQWIIARSFQLATIQSESKRQRKSRSFFFLIDPYRMPFISERNLSRRLCFIHHHGYQGILVHMKVSLLPFSFARFPFMFMRCFYIFKSLISCKASIIIAFLFEKKNQPFVEEIEKREFFINEFFFGILVAVQGIVQFVIKIVFCRAELKMLLKIVFGNRLAKSAFSSYNCILGH